MGRTRFLLAALLVTLQISGGAMHKREDFQSQLRDSMEWLEQRGGGLLLGDFNRVVC